MIALSLLAAVTLYENGREIQTHLLTIPSVKALLNQGDPALGIPPHFWDRMERGFQSPEFRMLFNDGLPLLEQELQRQARTPGHEQSFLIYAGKEVSHSSLTNEEKDRAALRLIRGLRRYQDEIFRQSKDVLGEGTQQVSKGFGNLTGLVEYRKGKLFNQPEWIAFVLERLEPGDLLLERRPFRLTNKFIPGHFGHVAMYVGTETQLHNLGLWNHPWGGALSPSDCRGTHHCRSAARRHSDQHRGALPQHRRPGYSSTETPPRSLRRRATSHRFGLFPRRQEVRFRLRYEYVGYHCVLGTGLSNLRECSLALRQKC